MVAALTIIFITALTIIAELHPPTKDWLQTTFTHHWIGKSVLALVVFGLLSAMRYFFPNVKPHFGWLSGVALGCAVALFGFFLYEYYF